MAKIWQTGDIITANELNHVEADIAGKVSTETDPFVTGGFKLYLQRVAGEQTLTLSGAQQLFFVK